jgi:Tol biopolymer transport system component
MSRFVALLATVAAALVMAGAGHATFPGAEGRIAFTSDRSAGTDNVFSMKPDGSDVRQLTFLTAADGGDGEPAWSPDGTRIVFTEHTPDGSTWRLWLMNADGSNRHLLFTESDGLNDFQGNWSPDGSRVIFRRCNDAAEECAVYTVRPDGRGLKHITDPRKNARLNDFDVKPELSPNGRTISFSSFNRGGVQNGVYLMTAGGKGIRLITPTGLGAVDADWAPDGSRIAFWTHCCNPQNSTIASMDPDGSNITELTSPGASHDIRPSYSPQGTHIAFERDAPDFSTSSVMVMNADGSGPTTIQADAFSPNWGPAA